MGSGGSRYRMPEIGAYILARSGLVSSQKGSGTAARAGAVGRIFSKRSTCAPGHPRCWSLPGGAGSGASEKKRLVLSRPVAQEGGAQRGAAGRRMPPPGPYGAALTCGVSCASPARPARGAQRPALYVEM